MTVVAPDPARPALAAVRAALDGVTVVAEAWEILDARGLLPPESPARHFVAQPATIPALVAWASLGAEAIVTAEALAQEAVRELAEGYARDRGYDVFEKVVWSLGWPNLAPNLVISERRYGYLGLTRITADGSKFSIEVDGEVRRTRAVATSVRELWTRGTPVLIVSRDVWLCAPSAGNPS